MGLLGSTILGTEVGFRAQMGLGSGPFLGQALSHGASHSPCGKWASRWSQRWGGFGAHEVFSTVPGSEGTL